MRNFLPIALCLIIACVAYGQPSIPFHELINGVFQNNPDEEVGKTTTDRPSKTCGPDKMCVLSNLCKDNGINDVDNKCPFLQKCCDKNLVSTIPDENFVGCGHQNVEGIGPRITGRGKAAAEYGEFPWMVALFHENVATAEKNLFCGGSIIAPVIVLTGAHCVHNKKANEMILRAGEWDTDEENEMLPHQDRRALQIITHEKFDNETLYNDVALVILKTRFEWARNVQTLCLPQPNANFDMSRGCYAIGWGKDKLVGKHQRVLKKIKLSMVSRARCEANLRESILGQYFNLDESFTCAYDDAGDTCVGDGGSPLFCPIEGATDRYVQTGIVAWGVRCGAGFPSAYANVARLRSWINEKLYPKNVDFNYFTPTI